MDFLYHTREPTTVLLEAQSSGANVHPLKILQEKANDLSPF